jgi:hypothetical protein
MYWQLMHDEVSVTELSEVLSRSSIIFEHEGIEIKLADTMIPENHMLGSKKILVDTAYKLEHIARQMKSMADSLK